MADGLYFGGVMLPFVSSLRIYLPAENFTAMEMRYIEEALNRNTDRVSIDAQELVDTLGRITRPSGDPMPTAAVEQIRTFRWNENSALLYCPNQPVRRSVYAASSFARGRTRQLADLVLKPEHVARVYARQQADPRTNQVLFTRTANWGVPFSWFILFHENDRTEVVRSGAKVLTVRMQVPLTVAAQRASTTLKLLEQVAPEMDLFEELEDLNGWLEYLPAEGALELDYGPVANKVYPDDSPMDVRMGLESLAEGDTTGAAAAYRRLASRWMPIRQQSRSS